MSSVLTEGQASSQMSTTANQACLNIMVAQNLPLEDASDVSCMIVPLLETMIPELVCFLSFQKHHNEELFQKLRAEKKKGRLKRELRRKTPVLFVHTDSDREATLMASIFHPHPLFNLFPTFHSSVSDPRSSSLSLRSL